MYELPDYNKITFPDNPPIPFEVVVPDASFEALDLLKKFLVYQSKKRVSAKEVGDRLPFAINEPCHQKICLWDFSPGQNQTR